MEKHIMKILKNIVRAKGMKIVRDEDCEFRAEKGWGANKEIIDIYYYRYVDESYDVVIDRLVNENVEAQHMKTTRVDKVSISEQELIDLLNEFK